MLKHSVYHHVPNRRRVQRYPVGWRARLTNRGQEIEDVQLSDASEDGLQFVCRERFRTGDTVEMDVFTSWRSFFRSTATIVRVGRRTPMGQEYGIRFNRMTDIDRAVLIAGLKTIGGGTSTPQTTILSGTAA